jgi:ubiquinone/menaquinone biosynthesis C-methylase UbiE
MKKVVVGVLEFLKNTRQRVLLSKRIPNSVRSYWTGYTIGVSEHWLVDSKTSLDFFWWRCNQYPGYLELMPVKGHDQLDILDFGCGPGHDLIGLSNYSTPKSLVGVDVSETSVNIANRRLRMDPRFDNFKAVLLEADDVLPFADASFDYIHSSGVLHHVSNLEGVLLEMKRVLRPGGKVRLMVYNEQSIWRNLYVPYVLQIRNRSIPRDWPIEEAFRVSTDGPMCPISKAYSFESFSAVASQAGFSTSYIGASMSDLENEVWSKYASDANRDLKLNEKYRNFVASVRQEGNTLLMSNGRVAGINLVIELTI